MARGMLGGVRQESEHRGWQTRTTDLARIMQLFTRRRADLVDCSVDCPSRLIDERWQVVPRRVRIGLALEGRELTLAQLLPTSVGQEAIQAPAEMTQMVGDARGTVRLEPELGGRKAVSDPRQVLARLHERVCRRLKVFVDPLDWPSKPCFWHCLAPE